MSTIINQPEPTGSTITVEGEQHFGKSPRVLLRNPKISPQAKTLFALLHDYVSPGRPAPFPAKSTLGDYLGVSARSIRTWMIELEEHGFVRIESRQGRSNKYVLDLNPGSTLHGGGMKQASRGGEGDFTGGMKQASPRSRTTEVEPLSEENTTREVVADSDGSSPSVSAAVEEDGWNYFWFHYRRKVGKAAARKAWDKQPVMSSIIEALSHYNASIDIYESRHGPLDKKFVMHPSKFINGEYEDFLDGPTIDRWPAPKLTRQEQNKQKLAQWAANQTPTQTTIIDIREATT